MVDLLAGSLRAMGEPAFDMVGLVGPQRMQMVAPELDVAACRGDDLGRLVEVEDAGALLGEEPALGDQPVLDDLRFAGCPDALLHRVVAVEPDIGGERLVAAADLDWQHPRVDRRRGPDLARRAVDVGVIGREGDEVGDRQRLLLCVPIGRPIVRARPVRSFLRSLSAASSKASFSASLSPLMSTALERR